MSTTTTKDDSGRSPHIIEDRLKLQAYQCARLATLSILGNLKRELGSLDRVTAWLVINGFVNVEPGFVKTTTVINGCSELILQLYGEDAGRHARTAMGVAATPFGLPVIIAAEVEISI
jgi:hypothetical protein